MDTSEYKNEFISEAKEHLESLNESLLSLEKDPCNSDSIDEAFRSFHTLKGNSAIMGFSKISELSHALEDVLSKVRDKELTINTDVMNLIFEGCDLLESGIQSVEESGSEKIEPEHIISEIKDIIDSKEENICVDIHSITTLSEDEKKEVEKQKKAGKNIWRVVLIFDSSNPLKGAKCGIIIRELSQISNILKTNPYKDNILLGKFDSEVEFVISTNQSKQDLTNLSKTVSGIREVIVLGIDENYEKPNYLSNEEKEKQKQEITSKHHSDAVKQIQSVRVDMKKLDKLMGLIGELLINNIRLQDINKKKDFGNMRTVVAGIERLTFDLQDEITQVRMVPIGNIFNRFPRMVRDLAKKEGKKVNLMVEGQEIEFDRTVLDEIGDPLVHLLRNSVDHGIESPDARANSGKPEEGIVKLIARREKSNAVIEIIDDGAGIDTKKVREASIKKGLISDSDELSVKELQMMVFKPGLSTSSVVTDVSGRGVGMDVVINKINQLGGSIELSSELGKGTSVIMRLPLTLAIISALLVKVNDETYAIPFSAIDRLIDLNTDTMKTIQGNKVFILNDEEIPLFYLSSLMGHENTNTQKTVNVIIVNKSDSRIGLAVDSIVSQQQILIKSLQQILKGTKGVAGATILGDGSVALIVDVGTLL